ncbi:TRAP transporter large permease [Alkalihalobacillus oceani]|uniref:TRAP transporter large permease n=1 Tax=Halalkalibacter oceani TaxID=1653776 RepID=UPI00203F63F6|nr:TRAP transporter large permease [Halalkalibacter oceani]MCM3760942.1 TRAP transporter large permease [Halalkalibacter oceani]
MILALFVLLLACLFIGVPIFISLAFPSMIAIMFFTDNSPSIIAQRLFGGLDQFGLMAMPLFIFAAQVMLDGGMARKLLDWSKALVSWMPGGTAFTTHFSSLFFGALSGSSPATVAAIGGIMYPELEKEKYDRGFSVGLISSSSSVAIIIPPSVTMILYGVATGVSIGSLFIAGIGAGILYTLVLGIYVWYRVKKDKQVVAEQVPFNPKQFISVTIKAIWALGIPFIILGGIYMGIFSPTEAAGISVVYSIFVSMFIYKEMNVKQLYKSSVKAAVLTAQVMILTGAAAAFGWILSSAQLPQTLANLVLEMNTSPVMFLLLVNVVFLVAGMFMDGSGAIMILAPLVYPIGLALGIDPVHLGVIVVTNLAIGMFTPPLGLNLFVANGITGVPFSKMIPSTLPFLAASLIALALITYVEDVSMFLPRLIYP